MKPKRNASGIIVCLAIGLLGLCVLGGFYLAVREARLRAHAPEVPWGTPASLRLAACDLGGNGHTLSAADAVTKALHDEQADILLIRGVSGQALQSIAAATGFTSEADPSPHLAYYPSQEADGPAAWGTAIISRYPLYEDAPIPNAGNGGAGVWAVCVVEGRRFMVACVDDRSAANSPKDSQAGALTSAQRAWQSRGSPPIVIGSNVGLPKAAGGWRNVPAGVEAEHATQTNPVTRAASPTTVVAASHPSTGGGRFIISSQWSASRVKTIDTSDGPVIERATLSTRGQ